MLRFKGGRLIIWRGDKGLAGQTSKTGCCNVLVRYYMYNIISYKHTQKLPGKHLSLLKSSICLCRNRPTASRTVSVPYAYICVQLVLGCGLLTCKEMKGKLVHSPITCRINSFILPRYSKLFWSSSLLSLFVFEWVLWSRLDWVWSPLSMIDWHCVGSRFWSPPNAIAWIERCFSWLS